MVIDPSRFEALTFDCYGTLMDWESGILAAMAPLAKAHGAAVSDAEILGGYARLESQAERPPYRSYREVLRMVATSLCRDWGFEPSPREQEALVEGFVSWVPFPDTIGALGRLRERFRLGIISNVDDDLFGETRKRLGVEFDWVTTAAQARCYKPDHAIFTLALERMGLARERILHAAQSLYHDVAPASALGLATVWVNRPSRAGRFGVAPPITAAADWEVTDLAGLVRKLEPSG